MKTIKFKTAYSHGELVLEKPPKNLEEMMFPDYVDSFKELLEILEGTKGDILEISLIKAPKEIDK